jgi:hypothetical protein|uniref:Uncharacterized protein n=1 Tax=candidate division WOR-3 bacterium TaxID=2052148 RepID=A0A7V3PTZ5_UNCW3
MNKQPQNSLTRVERQVLKYARRCYATRAASLPPGKLNQMINNYAHYSIIADRIYQLVKKTAEKENIPVLTRRFYYIFCLEVEKVLRLHPDRDNTDELLIRHYKWIVRGLNPATLLKLETALRHELGIGIKT